MRRYFGFLALVMFVFLNGCATKSSSTVTGPEEPAWEGPVRVSQAEIPSGIDYTVIGTVEAKAQAGYEKAEKLFPVLAEEAKKIGANGVFEVEGGRRVTAFSWSAAYVGGTAIRLDDPDDLDELPGSNY